MRQGESAVQKDLAALLTYMHCGTGDKDLALKFRGDLDRKLDDFSVHTRPARYAGTGGADYVTFILPQSYLPDDPATVHALASYMSWNMGLMRTNSALTVVPTVDGHLLSSALQLCDNSTRSYHLVGLADDSNGDTHMQCSIRYFKVGARFRDGTPDYYSVVTTNYAAAKAIGSLSSNEFSKQQLIIDMSIVGAGALYTEKDAAALTTLNSARILPGHLELFNSWPHLSATTAGGVDNSICGLGGLLNAKHSSGSNVSGLLGYSKPSPAIRNVLQTGLATAIGRTASNQFSQAQIDAAVTFDPNMWRAIVEERGTQDDFWWNTHAWHVVAVDQDLLDFDRAIFCALATGHRMFYLGPLHRGIVMNDAGDIVREMEGISDFTSMGGVAVGKNNYSDADVSQPTGDRDGDTTTSIPDDGED
jgi:hypothetical protein